MLFAVLNVGSIKACSENTRTQGRLCERSSPWPSDLPDLKYGPWQLQIVCFRRGKSSDYLSMFSKDYCDFLIGNIL